MPDYQDNFDTRVEEMETEQLLRRVKFHLENPDLAVTRPAPEMVSGKDFENIHLGNEMYFQLDYAAKIYDPRTVPANTRFRSVKNLIMRVMRLYATRQVEFNATVVKLLNMFQDRFEEVVSRFSYFRESEVKNQEALKTLGSKVDEIAAGVSRLQGVENAVHDLAETNEQAAVRLAAIEAGFKELHGLVDDLQLRNAAIGGVFSELKEKLSSGNFTVTAGGKKDAAPSVIDDFEKAWQSADYELFEDESRGDVADIRERLGFYVPLLEKAAKGGGLIADLGCGRGELIELLKEKGLSSLGIDNNEAAVIRGKEAGLNMECKDLFAFLREAKEGSLAAVTAMHVIEHMTPSEQGEFLALSLKALKPGGLIAMETPNIMNLHVASCDFYSDITHVRPVHPVALRNRMKQMGYKDIDIKFLHPFPKSEQLDLDAPGLNEETKKNFEKINDLIWGCRDCVILATKKEKV